MGKWAPLGSGFRGWEMGPFGVQGLGVQRLGTSAALGSGFRVWVLGNGPLWVQGLGCCDHLVCLSTARAKS